MSASMEYMYTVLIASYSSIQQHQAAKSRPDRSLRDFKAIAFPNPSLDLAIAGPNGLHKGPRLLIGPPEEHIATFIQKTSDGSGNACVCAVGLSAGKI